MSTTQLLNPNDDFFNNKKKKKKKKLFSWATTKWYIFTDATTNYTLVKAIKMNQLL